MFIVVQIEHHFDSSRETVNNGFMSFENLEDAQHWLELEGFEQSGSDGLAWRHVSNIMFNGLPLSVTHAVIPNANPDSEEPIEI